jgi:hypothetical protein
MMFSFSLNLYACLLRIFRWDEEMSGFLVEQVSGETGCEDESTDLGVNGQKSVDEAMKGESGVDESATNI